MHEPLKEEVRSFWNAASCGTEVTQQEKFSLCYFEEIEAHRYRIEPEIFSFAQFTRWHHKKIVEVGVGAGTDFIQWARAGAHCYGIDLTQEAIDNTQKRLELYGLKACELRVADAEKLPYQDAYFDLAYSWGVIHHSPDMKQCLSELIRVTKPGGTIKIMIYNRRSLFAVYQWIKHALCKGKPWRSISEVLFHHQESKGTKAYTFNEVKILLRDYPVTVKLFTAPVTAHDLLYYKSKIWRLSAYSLATLTGWLTAGWFMMIELEKQ